ncbi:MAG TPA: phosphatase domain-containing protein [Polyangia bacterium]|nr:phosphatase domain-containing protein [Polyangia bacterium]
MVELAHIFRWDLDKTYLRTDFETLRGLVRSAFEKAEQKQAVPGASALLRELRASGSHRICFISGSPRQMRKVLEQKLKLDGVQFDEFILKPNVSNLLRGRFRALREQVGYKLPALLAGRLAVNRPVPETLFGDDAEGDAFIYSLYADIVRGAVNKTMVAQVFERVGTYPDVAARTLALIDGIELSDVVRRIFIILDKRSPPARFDRYGARVVPIYNYFQAAAVLYQDRVLDAPALVRVALDMVGRASYEVSALASSFQDLVRRGRLSRASTHRLGAELDGAAALAGGDGVVSLVTALGHRVRALGSARAQPAATLAEQVDYLAALAEDPPRLLKPPGAGKKKK